MGGTSSSSQTSSSSVAPYGPASGPMNGILGQIGSLAGTVGTTPTQQETNTINGIVGATDKLAPYLMRGATGLLSGGGATQYNPQITQNLGMLNNGIVGQTASGNNSGANNPSFMKSLDVAGTNAKNAIDSSWTAAGRQPGGSPGANANVAGAITNAEAPIIQSQWNTDNTNALNAANTLYNAGNSTYGMLNANTQAANNNIAAGTGVASSAIGDRNAALTAEQQYFGIPASQLTTLLGSVSPVAQAFGTTTGQSDGTQTMSGAQQFALIANGLGSMGNLFTPKRAIPFGS